VPRHGEQFGAREEIIGHADDSVGPDVIWLPRRRRRSGEMQFEDDDGDKGAGEPVDPDPVVPTVGAN
jgi:hypothetical protein